MKTPQYEKWTLALIRLKLVTPEAQVWLFKNDELRLKIDLLP